jgi:hypothetical protein
MAPAATQRLVVALQEAPIDKEEEASSSAATASEVELGAP